MSSYLVVGAASAFGTAIVHALAKGGGRLTCVVERADAGALEKLRMEVADSIDAIHVVSFVDRSSLEAMILELEGTYDGVVFTHMYFRMEDPERFDYGEWDRGLAENLSAPNIVFREIGSKLRDRASLVAVTSTEGFTGSFGASGFAAAKAAMQSLTKSLANLYGARSIRVNCVAPGWVAGVMDTDDAAKESCSFTPLARLGSTDEVAAAVAFLLSEDSSFITGTTLVVDGGYLGVDPVARFEYELSRGKEPLT